METYGRNETVAMCVPLVSVGAVQRSVLVSTHTHKAIKSQTCLEAHILASHSKAARSFFFCLGIQLIHSDFIQLYVKKKFKKIIEVTPSPCTPDMFRFEEQRNFRYGAPPGGPGLRPCWGYRWLSENAGKYCVQVLRYSYYTRVTILHVVSDTRVCVHHQNRYLSSAVIGTLNDRSAGKKI